MIKAKLPSNEIARIEALKRYEILDTLSEQAYNDITKIASSICETQIAVISLVDSDRQWFKSAVGLDAAETPRDVAFCAHAILKDELMVVKDATKDERFHDNPLVIGEPQIKFYAGAPLVTSNGLALGTLCVIDRAPRELSLHQSEVLSALSRQVMNLLELRLNIKALGVIAQELTDARNESVRLAQVKSDFLANMSHEIRTPMNGIMGMTEILLQSPLSFDQKECANYIDRSARDMLTLLNDVLDHSKIEAGKLKLDRTEFCLKTVLSDIEKTFALQTKQKGIDLKFDYPDLQNDLIGDVTRIKQILINFISNAIKFTSQGSVRIRVTKLSAKRFSFEVQDSGIGIPEDSMHLLFQEFSQVDSSTTRKYGGTGLGLSICKRLVELMKGEIGATSRVGQGSCFWFSLDLDAGIRAADVMLLSGAAHDAKASVPAAPLRVLVAEDHRVNQVVVSKLLALLGYECHIVNNGLEALKAVETGHYDLVLMDCQMPVMDGYESAQRIRNITDSRRRQIPIVALTATTRQEDLDHCLHRGMNDCMSKPFTLDQLRTKIESVRQLQAG